MSHPQKGSLAPYPLGTPDGTESGENTMGLMNQRQQASKDNTGESGRFGGYEATTRITFPVVLIGPVNAGKSTIADMVAKHLRVGRGDLDVLCWDYFEQAGYDPAIAREHYERDGRTGKLKYMGQFYAEAVERILAEYRDCVIDLGAGHTVYDNLDQRARVKRAFAPHPNVVLLMPSSDLDESIRILGERQGHPDPDAVARNNHFVRSNSNLELAKLTLYTKDKTPNETCGEVLACLK